MCALAVLALAACGGGGGGSAPPVTRVTPTPQPGFTIPPGDVLLSTDPFTNPSTQHRTEVEPEAATSGRTIVATFQVGRSQVAGASDAGYATSHDGGITWTSGVLPGLTNLQGSGAFPAVSDPAVAYDAAHGVWLIATLPVVLASAQTPAALVSSSTDGVVWSNPVAVAPNQASTDKEWIACDSFASSPFYGHCYIEWDDPSVQANGLIHMSTSSDGGKTWSAPAQTADNATGIAGEPVVQPNGTVVVPIDDFNLANLLAFTSADGGATWSASTHVATIDSHFSGGGLRAGPLPSVAEDGGGTVYVMWADCRFRNGCAANDLVFTTTHDGKTWTSIVRVPLDPLNSTVDHFIPGLALDPATTGASAHVGLTYFYYPQTRCTLDTCALTAGFTSSTDGGASWTAPRMLAGPMQLTWIADTDLGEMVGDYTTTTFSLGRPVGVFAVALPRSPSLLNEAMYAAALSVGAGARIRVRHERPVPGLIPDRVVRPRPEFGARAGASLLGVSGGDAEERADFP